MDRNDAVKNIAMYYAMLVKYSRDVPEGIHDKILEYIINEDEELPVGLQPFKDHVIQLKRCIEIHARYVLPIPGDMRESIEDKFDEIGEDKFVEWFRKQDYKDFTPVEQSLNQTALFQEDMKDGA